MSGFLLDTDTITLAQFGHSTVITNLAQHHSTDINLPVIAIQEQMRGWLSRLPRLTTPSQMEAWYDRLVNRVFPVWRRYPLASFTQPAILRFEHHHLLRLNVGLMDLRIAAIAIENGLTVVTRNLRDFGRVPALTAVDWSV